MKKENNKISWKFTGKKQKEYAAEIITIRVTPTDKKAIAKAAELAGDTMTGYILSKVL